MGNIADEFYDEYYSLVCPSCHENECDEFMPMCHSCWLDELANGYSDEDANLEMSLNLE